MSRRRDLIWLTILLLSSLGLSCSPLSKPAIDKVERTASLAMVAEAPDRFIGKHLLLGGTIIRLEKTADGTTLEILSWETTPWGEPLFISESGQRVLVKSTSVFDPELYQAGRLVTLIGIVTGSEAHIIRDNPYHYPVFALEEIHLWNSPYRYGIHPHPDPQFPYYVGPEERGRSHPYDPGYYAYPYTPYWYRVE